STRGTSPVATGSPPPSPFSFRPRRTASGRRGPSSGGGGVGPPWSAVVEAGPSVAPATSDGGSGSPAGGASAPGVTVPRWRAVNARTASRSRVAGSGSGSGAGSTSMPRRAARSKARWRRSSGTPGSLGSPSSAEVMSTPPEHSAATADTTWGPDCAPRDRGGAHRPPPGGSGLRRALDRPVHRRRPGRRRVGGRADVTVGRLAAVGGTRRLAVLRHRLAGRWLVGRRPGIVRRRDGVGGRTVRAGRRVGGARVGGRDRGVAGAGGRLDGCRLRRRR